MKAIHAIWRDGQIVPTQPIDWPDGTALSIEPVEEPPADDAEGDLLGNDPASIARWIAYYEALPLLRMTAAEEAEWQDCAAGDEGLHHRRDARAAALEGHREPLPARHQRRGRRDVLPPGCPRRVTAARAAGHDIGIGIPVLGELYGGIEFSATRDDNLDILRRSLSSSASGRSRPRRPRSTAAPTRSYAARAGSSSKWTCRSRPSR